MDTLRLIWRFESRAARRAFVDTWHFYGDNPMRAVVLATACVLVGSLINYRLHGWESMMAELITWVIYGLAPIGALTLALLMWNFFAAPSKLFDEIQRQLADLHASSNDKDPNLAIQFEPSRHVVMHESGGAGTFRVEAVNTSQKTISGVSIRIVSIAGDTEERTREYQKFVG